MISQDLIYIYELIRNRSLYNIIETINNEMMIKNSKIFKTIYHQLFLLIQLLVI